MTDAALCDRASYSDLGGQLRGGLWSRPALMILLAGLLTAAVGSQAWAASGDLLWEQVADAVRPTI
jgi:hypothetical protein